MSITRLAALFMMASVTFASKKEKNTITIDGKEIDLDEKMCAINYEIYTVAGCKNKHKFKGDTTDAPLVDLVKYRECHKAPLKKYKNSLYDGNFMFISCKRPNKI